MSASYQLRFDTGRLFLDLVATVGGRLSGAPVERLDHPERLAEWLAGAGLVPAGQPVRVTAQWLAHFRELRDLLHRLAHAAVATGRYPEADVQRLNRYAAVTPPQIALRADGVIVPGPVRLTALLSVVARNAIEVLGGADVARLRVCGGDTCDLIYVDDSRGGRRRWCSSTACGNRVRVQQHRGQFGPPAAG